MEDKEALKKVAAEAALDYVKDGHVVGLGTGSTVRHLLAALQQRVQAGLRVTGVPTSEETAELARKAGIPLLTDDDLWPIDVAIDGADQVDPRLHLIKGGGGALLREKIVASNARQLVIMIDETKQVPVLGGTFPLPIEVLPFGWRNTACAIEQLGGKTIRRERNGHVFRTVSGHYILDLHMARIDAPAELEARLNRIPGVIECGLFVGQTDVLIVGTSHGVEVHKPLG
ncbi:ribose-5-phosphate isomerase RpiA [Nitrospira sp. Nam74]